LSKKTFAGPASKAYEELFTTLAFMNAWVVFFGTVSYSISGSKLMIAIETLWFSLSDGIDATRGISNVLVDPIPLV
jgi:hypothetical protein